ncbi:NAD-dependent epimerase/dehydratase family protein [Fictibacillus nanhaiensis]|uniref:NAD-dependent epimerase/dehydratase family protein n=1 Tax=Fictibacillus nanhaiensis TaxID=742169 RepID=UPI001C95143C|nr:NAD-dependent epimerase/dehydratase family protein [Fictibacillus nanhaiensis]MBY6036994.1 NAD-dependent epimerase/dehydratase family protein [Fictibacillus nanhaiensis]
MEIKGKRILVTGITGTLGERVAISFLEEAKEVRGLVRDGTIFKKYEKLGIIPVQGELTNRASLQKSLVNVDIVVHCAAYLGDDMEQATHSNVIGVENIASLSLEAGVQKFIHISTLSVYGEPNEGHITEDIPIVQEHEEPYIHTKAKSEHILMSYVDKGLDVVVLRPGSICAEENSYWGDRQVYRMIKADVVDWVHPEDMIAWIHSDNLVDLIHLVIRSAKSGEVFNAIDGNFPETEFRMRIIKVLGKLQKLPNREVQCPIYSDQKIKNLGYVPNKVFSETIANLEHMAVNNT